MSGKYILEGHNAIPCDDLTVWAKSISGDRHVALDKKGDVEVSTVFLGLDHCFGSGLPLLFETMVFGGEFDGEQDRYSTWEEAEIGHQEKCKKVWKEVTMKVEEVRTVDKIKEQVNQEYMVAQQREIDRLNGELKVHLSTFYHKEITDLTQVLADMTRDRDETNQLIKALEEWKEHHINVFDLAIRTEYEDQLRTMTEERNDLKALEKLYKESLEKYQLDKFDLEQKLLAMTEAKEKAEKLYHKLLFAVGNRYKDESRYETALRYIRQAETTPEEASDDKSVS